MKRFLLWFLLVSIISCPSLFAKGLEHAFDGTVRIEDVSSKITSGKVDKKRSKLGSVKKNSEEYYPSADAPAHVTAFVMTPDPAGEYTVKIDFVAPVKTFGGNDLASIDKIEIYRDETLITTFANPAPGESLSYVDNTGTFGDFKYTIVAYNDAGRGEENSNTVYVGSLLPAAPSEVSVIEAEEGVVSISWAPVTTDKYGNYINPAKITYSIMHYNSGAQIMVAENLTDTSWTGRVVKDGEQEIIQFIVFAVTEAGIGEGRAAAMVPFGTPYTDYSESFANGELHYSLGVDIIRSANLSYMPRWHVGVDSDFIDMNASDDDNGFLYMDGYYSDDSAGIFTGKISLADFNNPFFFFSIYNIIGKDKIPDENEVLVQARKVGEEEYTTLLTTNPYKIGGDVVGWHPVRVNLCDFVGQVIQLRIVATLAHYDLAIFDNLRIATVLDDDLRLEAIVPESADAGSSFQILAKVHNDGAKAAEGAKVNVYIDNEKRFEANVETLLPVSSVTIPFTCEMHTLATEPLNIKLVLEYPQDNDQENNVVDNLVVLPVISSLKSVSGLSAEIEGGKVSLTWNAPVFEVKEGSVTEDFERYDPWSKEIEGWTILDLDGEIVGGITGVDMPGISRNPSSFFIGDATADESKMQAHSGTQFLGSLFNNDYTKPCDDWAISPLLNGEAQTISFWAKSYLSTYAESVEVLYSKGSNAPEDFTLAMRKEKLPGEWTLYEVEIPAGSYFFAIHAVSCDCFMLMIDDVTYQPDGYGVAPEIIGYNVWRNNEKINDDPITDTTYVDSNVPFGNHNYAVTALYARGESPASNIVEIIREQEVGVGSIAIEKLVNVSGRTITIPNTDGKYIAVTSANGYNLFSGNVSDTFAFTVDTAGVYFVRIGDYVGKVIVK